MALAGQVGNQIKIRVGDAWLLASVRDQRKDRRTEGGIMAHIDFLGEGGEEKLTGRIHVSITAPDQPTRSQPCKAMPSTQRLFWRTAVSKRSGKNARVAISRLSAPRARTK